MIVAKSVATVRMTLRPDRVRHLVSIIGSTIDSNEGKHGANYHLFHPGGLETIELPPPRLL